MNKTLTLEEEINVWLWFWVTTAAIFLVLWVVTQWDFKKKK
jgi:hypothetical protein